jgi:hypothetical protein
MPCQPSSTRITDDLTKDRVAQFMLKKTKILDPIVNGGENTTLAYPFEVFIPMLEMFAASTQNYSGLRIYFASYVTGDADTPGGQEEKLTLLYVPTKKKAVNANLIIHVDDLSSIFTIINGQLKHLADPSTVSRDKDQASRWVSNFQKNRIPKLEPDGANHIHDTGYRESRSLWYGMGALNGDSTIGEPGIIRYARCMNKTPDEPGNPVDGIVVRFAAFTDDEFFDEIYPPYQLTVIFVLHQKNDPPEVGITLGSGTDHLTAIPTDTGLPCPPDNGCTGGGTLLPVS